MFSSRHFFNTRSYSWSVPGVSVTGALLQKWIANDWVHASEFFEIVHQLVWVGRVILMCGDRGVTSPSGGLLFLGTRSIILDFDQFCFPVDRIWWLMAQNDGANALITLQSSYLTLDKVFPHNSMTFWICFKTIEIVNFSRCAISQISKHASNVLSVCRALLLWRKAFVKPQFYLFIIKF